MVTRMLVPLLAVGMAASTLSGGTPQRQVSGAEWQTSATVIADNRFGLQLFQKLESTAPTKNLFISPLSIAQALQMTYNGARGVTQQEMAQTLNVDVITPQQLNHDNQAILSSLAGADPKIQLSIANSVWYNRRFTVAPDFLEHVSSYYVAEIAPLTGAQAINAWVSKHTHGRIPTIVENVNPQETPAILVNAVYFKGKWSKGFDTSLTDTHGFTLLNGTSTPCKMMHQSGNYSYLAGDGFQAVSLPYGEGKMSLIVVLPHKSSDFAPFLKSMDAATWNTWMGQMRTSEGTVAMPRLKLTYATSLARPLSGMGMAAAFDPSHADFTGMFPNQKVWIDDVVHKTFLEVNEEGTEAAAATGVIMKSMAVMRRPTPAFMMVIDHPFILAIRDNRSGAILFVGAIVHPTTS